MPIPVMPAMAWTRASRWDSPKNGPTTPGARWMKPLELRSPRLKRTTAVGGPGNATQLFHRLFNRWTSGARSREPNFGSRLSGADCREPTVGSRLSDVTRPDVIERIEMRVTRHVAKLQSPSEFKWASHVWPAFAEPSLTLAAPWGFQTRPAERPVPDRRCQVCERCLGRRQPVTLAVVTVRPCVQFRRSRRWLRARIGTGTCGLFFLLAMAAMARRRTRRLRHAAGNVRA